MTNEEFAVLSLHDRRALLMANLPACVVLSYLRTDQMDVMRQLEAACGLQDLEILKTSHFMYES